MNFKKLIVESVLSEIGDTTDFYQWEPEKADGSSFKVSFDTENGVTYYVNGKQLYQRPDLLSVDFGVRGGFFGKNGGVVMTGEQNQFKVISTVIQIIETAWKNRHELFDESEKLQAIHFTAAPKDGEDEDSLTSRGKVYREFIKTQFPNAKIYREGKTFIITPEETRRS
jgi:hypothetical protein